VDFRVSEEQLDLRRGVRSFCDGNVPAARLAELEAAGGVDAGLWKDLAELGVFALRQPEDRGGVGLGTADAALVFAELGRRVVPGPILWTHLAADLVEGAAGGEVVVGGIDRWPGRDEPVLVEHLERLDALLVVHAEGIDRIDPAHVAGEPVERTLDPLTPLHHVAALPAGERIAGAEVAARLARDGAALAAAMQLGIAEYTTEMAVAYAGEREQFDRVIGSFQAVKHILADMFVRQEAARAAVYAAGATIDQPAVGDVARAVSAAKVTAGEAAIANARACIQVHGGMGYTWEVPAHYYLKRSWVLDTCFGTGEDHALVVADAVAAQRFSRTLSR